MVNEFHDRTLPEQDTALVGYGALIKTYGLVVPMPAQLALISKRHKRYDTTVWAVFTPRHAPKNSLAGHLTFAFRYENLDLAVLDALFNAIDGNELKAWVEQEPVGQYSRRAWFLYEWLTDKVLDLPDVSVGNYVPILDPDKYYIGPNIHSKRHRVYNNFPGVRNFCPLVRKTDKLIGYQQRGLAALANKHTGNIHADILMRAAAFLLLQDTRASFAIEGEQIGKSRAERWGRAVSQAGNYPLSTNELLRLQRIVIDDTRFVKLGLRQEGGFIGTHDRHTTEPLPEHISARWQDLPALMQGLSDMDLRLKAGSIDPVIKAAMLAFGFVFIHPYADGNGRIHRYLIHHVLAEHGFSPKNIIFPVSAVILERINEYKQILEAYSRPRLKYINWQATNNGNVEVLNETINLYCYFDATQQAEFLYECVAQTIDTILPAEIQYLHHYDQMKAAINELLDMPAHLVDLVISFLSQNQGRFSKRAKMQELKALTETECAELEAIYSRIFVASNGS